MAPHPTKVLLDSGIGLNLDDAFAIVLACQSPEIDLIGVATTYYDGTVRASLAARLLGAYNRFDVPVCPGYNKQHDRPGIRPGPAHIRLAKEANVAEAPIVHTDVADFYRDLLVRHGPATIVATGPLSNIAQAVRRHPSIVDLIDEIVFMGGWTSQALPEHNIEEDPEALDILMQTSLPLRTVGYEVTLGCVLNQQHIDRLHSISDPGPRYLQKLYLAWTKDHRGLKPIMHDPLTIASITNPEMMHFRMSNIDITTDDTPGRGSIFVSHEEGRPVQVCFAVDTPRYLDHLIARVLTLPEGESSADDDPQHWTVHLRGAYAAPYYLGWRLRDVTAPCHLLGFVTEGDFATTINENTTVFTPGDAVYIPPHTRYSAESSKGARLLLAVFSIHVEGAPLDRIRAFPHHFALGDRSHGITSEVETLVRDWMLSTPHNVLANRSRLLRVLASLYELVSESTWHHASESFSIASKIRGFIESSIDRPITLDDIGRTVGMSKYHLVRVFKEATGISPMQYHLQIRMNYARNLLDLRQHTLSEVAAQIGYNSVNSFSRAFRREFGVTPTEYITHRNEVPGRDLASHPETKEPSPNPRTQSP